MVKVKICGITNIDDALFCSAAGADALGFIFYRRSPRYITPQRAKKIVCKLPPFVAKVGVFVDESKHTVLEIADYVGIDILQFHGKESHGYCLSFGTKFRVIKTFFPPTIPSGAYQKLNTYLFDIKWEEKLRKRQTLKADFLSKIKKIEGKNIIISGGLTPQNVLRIVRGFKPYAVDVSSGVEILPGRKDRALVKDFIIKVHSI